MSGDKRQMQGAQMDQGYHNGVPPQAPPQAPPRARPQPPVQGYPQKGPPPRAPPGAAYARPPGGQTPPVYGAPPAGYAQPPQQQYYAQPPQQQYHAQPQQQQQYPAPGYDAQPQYGQDLRPLQHNAGVLPPGFNNGAANLGAPPMQAPLPLGEWTTGLFDMGDDLMNCVVTFFCPCITFGQIAEVVDQGTTSCLLAGAVWVGVALFFGCPCFVSCLWRQKLRVKYNLPQGDCGDFCLHCWCESCALCQEYRELKNRGLDPSLGWEYLRRQQPAVPQAMMQNPQQAYMQR